MAMYVFQLGLDAGGGRRASRDPEPPPLPPPRRWEAAGADDDALRFRQPRRPVQRLDSQRQAEFDDIRRLEQRRERGHDERGGPERGGPASSRRPVAPRASPDVAANIPASCNG